jgi:ADP-heptose:LPS heptosyltransferase
MHLAVAVETPAISLHGTSRAWWCGAYGPTNQRLQAYYQDGSARARRGATNAAMCAITVADVLAACGRILDSPAQPVAGRCA